MGVEVAPLLPHVNAKSRGCRGDGSTDDLAAFNVAAAAANTLGLPLYLPPGTYILGVGTATQARPYDNLTIFGAGMGQTILKVKDDAGNYPAVLCPASGIYGALSDFTLRDLTIDQNADGNTTSDIFGTTDQVLAAFSCGESARITIDHVRIKDAVGVNTILVNSVDARELTVTNCRGNWKQGASSTTDYDNSFIYYSGRLGVFSNNIFVAGDAGGAGGITERARAAMELHGDAMTVTGNVVDGFQTLVNICTLSGGGNPPGAATVTGNTIINGNWGIQLVALTSTTLDGVTVGDNVIALSQLTHNENSYGAILLYDHAAAAGDYKNITIADNAISFETADNRTVDRQSVALNAARGGIMLTPRATANGINCHDNTIRDCPNIAIKMGTTTPTTISDSRIIDNSIIDAGRSTQGTRTALMLQGDLTAVWVERNQITDTGGTINGSNWIIASTGNGLGTCAALWVLDNRRHTVSGTNYSASLTVAVGKVQTLYLSQAVDPPSINAGVINTQTVTVPGARVGDLAVVNGTPPTAGVILLQPYVSANDTVALPFYNATAGAIDPANNTYKIHVRKNGFDTM